MSVMSEIKASDVQDALERVKLGKFGTHNSPSKNTYIRCPVDFTLWDLKPVVGVLLDGHSKAPREWVTNTYEDNLLRLNFPIIKFSVKRKRVLGINGFDASVLEEPHKIRWPSGEEYKNGFALYSQNISASNGVKTMQKRLSVVNRHVRDPSLVKRVKKMAKGKCGACNEYAFKTPEGEWFLEVHHKKWLREGGADTIENMIALCPNCHRQEHHGVDRKFYE